MNEYLGSTGDLESSSLSVRLSALRNLRLKVQENVALPTDFASLSTFFSQLKPRLSDSSPEVICQALLLTSDIIKASAQTTDDTFQAQPLESSIVLVLPPLVMSLGHSQPSVRKAALETLKTFLANISNSGALFTCLIKYGIENDEWRTRRESLDALTKLLTRDTGGFDQAHLVTSLISRLRDVSDMVVQQAIQALIHVRFLIGDEALLSYVKKLSGISRQLFRQFQGRVMSSSASQQLTSSIQKKTQMAHIPSESELESLAITGSPSLSNLRSAGSIQSLSVKALESQVSAYYGFIPESLFRQLQSEADWKLRSQAIEDLFHLTQKIADPKMIRSDISGLISFLTKFLHDSNFKMVLTSIHIIGLVIDIVGKEIVSALSLMSSNLIVKLADNKSLIRQAAVRTLIKLMEILDVSSVLDICMGSSSSDNPRIREEIVNIASIALLTFPKNCFHFKRLIHRLYNSLKDSKPRIKFCAMEAIAIIASIIGKDNIFEILDDLGLDSESTQLLTLRFNDPQLASLSPEGLLQHIAGTRSNPGTTAPQAPSPISKDPPKIFVSRSNSHAENHSPSLISNASSFPPKLNDYAIHSSFSQPTPQVSANPLLIDPTESFSNPKQDLEGKTRIMTPEVKRMRSLSETDTGIAQESPSLAGMPKGGNLDIDTIANQELSAAMEQTPFESPSIYAPNMKLKGNSFSKLPTTQSPILQTQIEDSPFSTNSKLSHSPPPLMHHLIQKDERLKDHTSAFPPPALGSDPMSDEQADFTSIKQPSKVIRNIKLSSAPPDRMMSLEIDGEILIDTTYQPPAAPRAKSSIDGPPKLSLATRRRMEAKTLTVNHITPEYQKKEKEFKARRQTENEYKDAVLQLRANGEWNELSDALGVVRKIIAIRPDLIQGNLHDLTLSLVSQVHNLRSSVAKVALCCLNDMFISLEKLMDTDLEVTVSAILKKVGESGFLVDEASKCLNSMAKHVTNTRALAALLSHADHKNSVIRQKVSALLQIVIYSFSEPQASRLVTTQREMERLLAVLVRLIRDGHSETRNSAKRCLFFLSKISDFEKVAEKLLSPSQVKEVQEGIEYIRGRGEASLLSENLSILDESQLDAALSPITKPKSLNRSKGSPTKQLKDIRVDDFEKLYAEMRVDDWKRRMDAVEAMVLMISQRPDDFQDRHTVQRLFDVFLDRCRDGNAKVTLVSLEALTKIIPILRGALDPVITLLVPVVANQMSSTSGPIRKVSNEAMDKLLEFSDLQLTIQSLTSILSFGANPKVKPLITEKLIEIVNTCYATKSGPITKYIVPASVKLLSESKRDIKGANDRLLLSLNSHMGPSLLLYTGNMTHSVREKIASLQKSSH